MRGGSNSPRYDSDTLKAYRLRRNVCEAPPIGIAGEVGEVVQTNSRRRVSWIGLMFAEGNTWSLRTFGP
jgi:hypothetical protein